MTNPEEQLERDIVESFSFLPFTLRKLMAGKVDKAAHLIRTISQRYTETKIQELENKLQRK